MNDQGKLTVRTFTGGGAFPLEGAMVRMEGTGDGNRGVYRSLLTDRDGNTPTVELPAPPEEESFRPGGIPFSAYDVEIFKSGYYRKKFLSVAVYPGIGSVLPVNMIPTVSGEYARTHFDPTETVDLGDPRDGETEVSE